jgi:RNA polymerase sigma factor (sigma-70 family)
MEVLSSEIKEVFLHFSKEKWEELWKRLRYFTYSHYRGLPSRVGGGIDLDDLIQDAIVDAITGKRKWPPGVKPVTFLCQVIRSKVSHMLEKENFRLKSLEETSSHTLTAYTESSFLTQPEDLQEQISYKELCNKILELVSEDNLLGRIVKLWISDPNLKPSEIAYMLGISIEEMRNAQKRLSRKLGKLRERWPNV